MLAIWAASDALPIRPSVAATRFAAATAAPREEESVIFYAERAVIVEPSKPLSDFRAKYIAMPAARPMIAAVEIACHPAATMRCDDPSPPPMQVAMSPDRTATPPALHRTPFVRAASQWSGSAWFAAREGSGRALGTSGQLGGSQAGFRVYRALTPALALTARGSGALSSPGIEGAAGVALRRGPLIVLAERRFAIDRGGRNAWSLTAASGFSEVALPLDLRLDGYAQAGLVDRDAFADGALRIERTLSAAPDARLAIGAGIWGGIQPGVARLDIGPQLVARTALAGRPSRVSIEWRQRVAGNAAPGSGPVVTLGTDF